MTIVPLWVKWTWSIIPASNEPPIRGNQSENRVGREEGGGQSDYRRKGSYTAVRREEGSQTTVGGKRVGRLQL